jgi:hypothetical protein
VTKIRDLIANPPDDVVWGSIAEVLFRRSGIHIAARDKSTDKAVRLAGKVVAEELAFLAVHLRPLAIAHARERMAKADKAVTVTGAWEVDPADAPQTNRR